MTDVSELIAKLENETGPSRELDRLIAEACGWRVFRGRWKDHKGATCREVWRFTDSIDAALTLVPEGDWNACFTTYYKSCHVAPIGPDSLGISDPRTGRCGGAATVAIALCIASLRARQKEA